MPCTKSLVASNDLLYSCMVTRPCSAGQQTSRCQDQMDPSTLRVGGPTNQAELVLIYKYI